MRQLISRLCASLLAILLLAPAAVASYSMPADHACCHHAAVHSSCHEPAAGISADNSCQRCPFCQSLQTSTQTFTAAKPGLIAPESSHPVLDEFFPVAPQSEPSDLKTSRAPPAPAL